MRRVCPDGWDPSEVNRGKPGPVWPWKRDALAHALLEERAECGRLGLDRDATELRLWSVRSRTFADKTGDAGGARRVFVRACARWLGVSTSAFILSAIDEAIVSTVAKCPGRVLPVTRREQQALVSCAIDQAIGVRRAETLAGLVEGGAI